MARLLFLLLALNLTVASALWAAASYGSVLLCWNAESRECAPVLSERLSLGCGVVACAYGQQLAMPTTETIPELVRAPSESGWCNFDPSRPLGGL